MFLKNFYNREAFEEFYKIFGGRAGGRFQMPPTATAGQRGDGPTANHVMPEMRIAIIITREDCDHNKSEGAVA
jgi:hypothetical protein